MFEARREADNGRQEEYDSERVVASDPAAGRRLGAGGDPADDWSYYLSTTGSNSKASFAFYRLPLAHHKHMKSTNMLERFHGERRRRTRAIRIFPNEASCLRLIRALAVETHEGWLEDSRYLNMEYWRKHRKQALRQAD